MILDKLLLNSVVCKKEIISIAADFCEDKRTVNLLMSEKNTLKNKSAECSRQQRHRTEDLSG